MNYDNDQEQCDEDTTLNNATTTIKINSNHTSQQNGNLYKSQENNVNNVQDSVPPPDGGSRAWFVMIGSFFCNGILFGVINSYSIIYTEIYDDLQMKNVSEAGSKAGTYLKQKKRNC